MRFFEISHARSSETGKELVSFGLRDRRGESLRGELLPTGSWTSRERQKAKAIAQVILDGEVALIHEVKEGRGTGLRKAMIFTRLESELLGESPRRESGTRQPDWQVGKRNPLSAKEPPIARQYQAWQGSRRNPYTAAVQAAILLLPLAQKAGANWLRRYKAAPVDKKVKMLTTASWFAGPASRLGWKFIGKKMRRDIAMGLDAQLKDPEVMEAAGGAARTAAIAVATRGRARNNPGPAADYLDILAHLRALQWLYTSAHWNSRGPNSYGDHLLYQRLYEGLGESIDQLGERYVAYYGPFDPVGVSNRASGLVADFRRAVEQMAVPVSHLLLLLEQQTQKMIRVAWKANQESSDMSLGLDDYLMALANNRDEAVYLLKQRTM